MAESFLIKGSSDGDIDCGTFEEDLNTTATHNVMAKAHAFMMIDGNEISEENVSEDTSSLEEHKNDPHAHKNLEVDGNIQ